MTAQMTETEKAFEYLLEVLQESCLGEGNSKVDSQMGCLATSPSPIQLNPPQNEDISS
ncbi:MAG: hypothetical protein ABIB79_03425 [archaeon]